MKQASRFSPEESVFKPLSDLEAAIKAASPGDLALLMVAVSKRAEETKNHMKIVVSPYHRHWTIGDYEISHDVRHRCYDICKGNGHLRCVNDLVSAVEWVLKDQGWQGGIDTFKTANVMARDMHAQAGELIKKAIALGQMKEGE